MKKMVILGSTGSIGTQALQICATHGYSVLGLAAHSNEKLLEEQTRKFLPKIVCIFDETHYKSFKQRVSDIAVKVVTGLDGLCEVASLKEAEIVLNAVMGMIGLCPTLAAIDAGKNVALANKETLVTGGELVMRRAKEQNVKIFPVDSEHSAIFQCLEGYPHCKVNRILLTASGGPFFGWTKDELRCVTPENALKHPNWSMGAKITIDSATMMNKGLELIEAVWLFHVKPEQIDILVHRESIVHSLVEFEDYSVIGQLGVPDMKIPIQYALTYPERMACPTKRLDLCAACSLTFAKPDEETFTCIRTAKSAIQKGKLYPTLMNSANECLVSLFLQNKIPFLKIGEISERVLELDGNATVTVENILDAEKQAHEFVLSLI
ncbi:MAG: 1-deoxy-D-xylulose-5-phosphate reductoisomerase [Oscillospiraceae bacterium]